MYKSPLRKDKHPTCSFWKSDKGNLYFHDFGIGKMYSLIEFVKVKFSLDYVGAVKRIEKDAHLMEKVGKIDPVHDVLSFTFIPESIENSKSYWDIYKIPVSIAAKYCFLAKSVYRNETFWGRSTKTNPIFVYKFISGNLKLYRPLAEKAKKWAGNANAGDVGGFFQLQKKGVLCFITSSIKDVMVLRQHGFPAICFNGEAYGIAEDSGASKIVDTYVKILKSRFKYVCLFLDNDAAGLMASGILSRKHKIPFITTKSKQKDISDFQKKYGVHKTYKTIKKSICAHFKQVDYVPF